MTISPVEEILARAWEIRTDPENPDPYDTEESVIAAMSQQGYEYFVILRKKHRIAQALRYMLHGHYWLFYPY